MKVSQIQLSKNFYHNQSKCNHIKSLNANISENRIKLQTGLSLRPGGREFPHL